MSEPVFHHRSGLPLFWVGWALVALGGGYWVRHTRVYSRTLRDLFGRGPHGAWLALAAGVALVGFELARERRRLRVRRDGAELEVAWAAEVRRVPLHEVEPGGWSARNWMRLALLVFVWGLALHATLTQASPGPGQVQHAVTFLLPAGMLLAGWIRRGTTHRDLWVPLGGAWLTRLSLPRAEAARLLGPAA